MEIVSGEQWKSTFQALQQGASYKIFITDPTVPACPVVQAYPGCTWDFENISGFSDGQMIGQPAIVFPGVAQTYEAQRLVNFTTMIFTEVVTFGANGNPSYGTGASPRNDFEIGTTVVTHAEGDGHLQQRKKNNKPVNLVLLLTRVTINRRLLVIVFVEKLTGTETLL